MKIESLLSFLTSKYPGLVIVNAWGEASLFYNPNGHLKRGAYCFTFKDSDGKNDSASQLNREHVKFRMNFKISKQRFLRVFDEPSLPQRPEKGGVITLVSNRAYHPNIINKLFPHPVYAWMSWVSIINPDEQSIQHLVNTGLLDESYHDAVYRHSKTIKKLGVEQ